MWNPLGPGRSSALERISEEQLSALSSIGVASAPPTPTTAEIAVNDIQLASPKALLHSPVLTVPRGPVTPTLPRIDRVSVENNMTGASALLAMRDTIVHQQDHESKKMDHECEIEQHVQDNINEYVGNVTECDDQSRAHLNIRINNGNRWFVYLLLLDGIPELRTCLSMRAYWLQESDSFLNAINEEITLSNHPLYRFYPNRTLYTWQNAKPEYKKSAHWRCVCIIDGFRSLSDASRFLELAKYPHYKDKSRYRSIPTNVMDRLRILQCMDQTRTVPSAIRGLVEALWLILHQHRAPNAKKGLGYAPADLSCYQPDAALRWIWLDAAIELNESMTDVMAVHTSRLLTEAWDVRIEDNEEM